MLKLPEELKNEIVKIIGQSNLPTNQGLGIIQALNGLEKLEVVGVPQDKPVETND